MALGLLGILVKEIKHLIKNHDLFGYSNDSLMN